MFALLVALLRGIVAPLCVSAFILASYFAALGALQLLVELGAWPGVDWKAPFFLFVLLVAIGADYGVFVLGRAREEARALPYDAAIARALEATGPVVTSCGVVLAGTFATLLLARIAFLEQVGIGVTIGVLIDTLIVRPFLLARGGAPARAAGRSIVTAGRPRSARIVGWANASFAPSLSGASRCAHEIEFRDPRAPHRLAFPERPLPLEKPVQYLRIMAAAIACGCAATSGPLVYADAVRDGVAGVSGIDQPAAIAISPDGAQLYVAGSGSNAVAIFARDADTGALHPAGVVRDGRGVQGLDQPGDVALSPDGAHVYVAGFDDDALAVFSRDAVTGRLRFVAVMRDRVAGVRGLGGAVSVAVSADGTSVYVAGREDDSLVVFARDAKSGKLRFVESERERDFGPTSLAIAPDGRHVYASGFDASALAVYERDPATGRLRRTAIVRDADDPAHALTNAASVAVSPDGRSVVAASYGEDALELFARDPETGALTPARDRARGRRCASAAAQAARRRVLAERVRGLRGGGRPGLAASRSTSATAGCARSPSTTTPAPTRSPRRARWRSRPTARTSTSRATATTRSRCSAAGVRRTLGDREELPARGARDRARVDPAARRLPPRRAAVAARERRARRRCPPWSSTSRTASGSARASATRRCTRGSRVTASPRCGSTCADPASRAACCSTSICRRSRKTAPRRSRGWPRSRGAAARSV